MPRAVPVLVLGLAILGCSKRPPATVVPASPVETPAPVVEPTPPPEETPQAPEPSPEPVEVDQPIEELPRPGGAIRALATSASDAATLLGALGAPAHLFAAKEEWRVDGPCWVVPVLSGAKASDVVTAWNAALTSGPGPLHWLLALGSARDRVQRGDLVLRQGDPRAQAEGVRLCGRSSREDLTARLEHPALRRAVAGRRAVAPASPFVATPDGWYLSNRDLAEGRPYVARVGPVVGGAPALLFKLGDVDVAIVQGNDVKALETMPQQVALARVVEREPTYFLWLNPQKRWLNSPKFRAWLAGTIERSEIVRLLFDRRGDRAYTLHADAAATPTWAIVPDAPLLAASTPRLTLHYDDADPAAKLLAARLRAEVSADRVDLQLRPTEQDRLLDAVSQGDVEVALLAHRPETSDPVLGLLGTAWWLGDAAREEALALIDATALEDPVARRQAAEDVEHALLADARVVPLVRLWSWLATRDGLVGVRVDDDGTLRLDTAWWRK